MNLGAEREIKVKDLINLIKDLVGFQGKVEWDTSKPDGQPRRMLDTARAKREFGFESKMTLEEGLANTIAWYEQHRHD